MSNDHIGVDELRTLIHGLNGGAVLQMRVHLPEDTEIAANCEGRSVAHRRLLSYVDYYEKHGEWPEMHDDELWDAYQDVSRSMTVADEEVSGRTPEPKIGVQ